MKLNPTVLTLANGLRVLHLPIKSTQLVHCSLVVNAGSSNEQIANNGAAHFIEHAVFKGSQKRKPYQLFNLVEAVGGEINAYTTREHTVFYTSSLKRYFSRSIDLLADLVFNPKFPKKELDKERQVILEEIEMYLDSPEDSIYDDFYSTAFPDQAMGFNILGSPESLQNIEREALLAFQQKWYNSQNMVLSIGGNISENRARHMAEKHFGHIALSSETPLPNTSRFVAPFNQTITKDFFQSHAMIGGPAYNRHHHQRFTLMVLNNLLGGNSMNSRLNLNIREKHGLVYHISSAYAAHRDTGVFMINFGCDPKNLDRTRNLVFKALQQLCDRKLGAIQLNSAKRQLQGQLAMMAENPGMLSQSMAKSLMHYGELRDLQTLFNEIDKVTAIDLQNVANEIFDVDNLCSYTYLTDK